MLAAVICALALIATFLATKRSLGLGLIMVAATGYFYGILRANLLVVASHFIFDASLAGLYLAFGSQFWNNQDRGRSASLKTWVLALIAWPCLLCLAPFQPLLVSIVGLRGNIFFLPVLLIGARVTNKDIRQLTLGLALLNLLALGIGTVEYYQGIERFFPRSEVTRIMYASKDVAGGHYRIPSLFTSAASYAGTMIATFPVLFGAWSQAEQTARRKLILLSGALAGMGGVLLASTRTGFVTAAYMVVVVLLTGNLRFYKRVLLATAILIVALFAANNERFGRFKTLSDSDMVADRIAGSVNRGYFEILFEYPMGNGLGGGGTSMPYFLQDRVQNPLAVENEYGRILAEQGIIGFLMWAGFIIWCVTQRSAFWPSSWLPCRRLIWYWYVFSFLTALLGNGFLTSIPATFILLLCVGWVVVAPEKEAQRGTVIRPKFHSSPRRFSPVAG